MFSRRPPCHRPRSNFPPKFRSRQGRNQRRARRPGFDPATDHAHERLLQPARPQSPQRKMGRRIADWGGMSELAVINDCNAAKVPINQRREAAMTARRRRLYAVDRWRRPAVGAGSGADRSAPTFCARTPPAPPRSSCPSRMRRGARPSRAGASAPASRSRQFRCRSPGQGADRRDVGVDVAIECVGKENARHLRRAACRRGVVVQAGLTSARPRRILGRGR